MALELKQELRLSQQLVMTPQLQQAIKLLQMNRLELVGVVQQELEENPVLEEMEAEDNGDGAEVDGPEGADTPEAPDLIEAFSDEVGENADSSPADSLSADSEPTDAEKIADIDWENYMEAYPQTAIRESRGDDERPTIETTPARRATLAEHLTWQLQLSTLSEEQREVATFLIGNLDDRGFLVTTLEDVARKSGAREEFVEEVLVAIQAFEPAGIAARDLRECLSIQLRLLSINDPIVFRIVHECLDSLIKRDFRRVARELGITIEEVAAATKVIGTLDPRPGRAFGGDETIYIVPDIYVYKIADEFHVMLNDDGLPRLRINNLYRDVLSRGSGASKETKTYVHEKVRSALWLIKSIHQRQRTIYKVMQSILKYQDEFFERGIDYLKPLNLRDVADDIEMHESTVSRVTTNKYVHTPRGIFELKYFFNSSIRKLDGQSLASESVKDRIGRLIRNEDPQRPLSDQRISEMLRVANINIARRTVTKYREALNILSSTKRRQVG